jgi:hypothetical protein
MKIRTGDIYRINLTKYKWVNQFVSGKVLNITCGKYLNYSSSKLLLENNADEVWSHDFLDIQQNNSLRKLHKGKITYQIKNKKELNLLKFNTILAFDILSVTDNVNESLKFIFDHLNYNGTAIISIINDDKSPNNNHDLITKNLNLFTKKELEQMLNSYFSNITFFSQGIITDIEKSIENTRLTFKRKLLNFLLKPIQNQIFYIKYITPMRKRRTKLRHRKEGISSKKYEISPTNEREQPLITIVVCKK